MLPLQVLCANDLFQCIMYLSPSITAWRWITSWLCSTNFILLTGSFSCSGLKALFQGPARIKQLLQANFAMNRCTRNFLQQELSDVFQVPKSKTSRKTHWLQHIISKNQSVQCSSDYGNFDVTQPKGHQGRAFVADQWVNVGAAACWWPAGELQ